MIDSDTDHLIGKSVGNYRIVKCLGKGGMGAVYHAEHPEIESKVAIKVLLPRFVSAPDIVKRFFDEARAVNRIGHPGIVRIHDCNEEDGVGVYLVMEMLEGETVSERFEAKGKLTIDVVVRLMQQVASALDASHKAGIVHRDLKPANIFIVPDPDIPGGERVKILDFGIAKLLEEHGSIKSGTETGAIIGSPLYMSPEQCIDSKNVDHRADIYSLGAIAYRMLSGEYPYEADTLGKLIIKHYKGTVRPIGELVPDLPSDLEWVIKEAMEVDREDRTQSMADLRLAVQEAMEVTEVELIDELDLEGWRNAPLEVVELTPPAREPPVRLDTGPAPPVRVAKAVADEDDPPGLVLGTEAAEREPPVKAPPPPAPKAREPAPQKEPPVKKPAPEKPAREKKPTPAKEPARSKLAEGNQTTLSGSSGEREVEAMETGGGRGLLIAGVVAALLGVAVAVVMVGYYGRKANGVSPSGAPSVVAAAPAPAAPPPEAKSTSVELVVTPSTARVRLDGQPVTSPLVLKGEGKHRLEVSAEGYEAEVREVGADSAEKLEIKLKKK